MIIISCLLAMSTLAIDVIKAKNGKSIECLVTGYSKGKLTIKSGDKIQKLSINKIATIVFDVKKMVATEPEIEKVDKGIIEILSSITEPTSGTFFPPFNANFAEKYKDKVIEVRFHYRKDITFDTKYIFSCNLYCDDHEHAFIFFPKKAYDWVYNLSTYKNWSYYWIYKDKRLDYDAVYCVVQVDEFNANSGGTILYAIGNTKTTVMGGKAKYTWAAQ